ncbi:hypothetical protein KEM48_006293 [Puccinia striiformis f. sp. tritici PST-130]|nr:hypothetical protein KEM48_006293 [Puccinia striiformis f. sp. tritici PST-130]
MAEVDALGDVCLNYQMAAILEVGHSLDEDERMISEAYINRPVLAMLPIPHPINQPTTTNITIH